MGLFSFLREQITGTPDSLRDWDKQRAERDAEKTDARQASIAAWNERAERAVDVRQAREEAEAAEAQAEQRLRYQVAEDLHQLRTLAELAEAREEAEYQARLAILFGRRQDV